MLSIPILPYPRETCCVFSLSLNTYESSIFVFATSSLPPIELQRGCNANFLFSGGNDTSRAREPCKAQSERKDNARQYRGGMSGNTGTTHDPHRVMRVRTETLLV